MSSVVLGGLLKFEKLGLLLETFYKKSYKLVAWSLEDSQGGLMTNAIELHYGTCRIQFLELFDP